MFSTTRKIFVSCSRLTINNSGFSLIPKTISTSFHTRTIQFKNNLINQLNPETATQSSIESSNDTTISTLDFSSKLSIKDLDWISSKVKSKEKQSYKPKTKPIKLNKSSPITSYQNKWGSLGEQLLAEKQDLKLEEGEDEVPHWKERKDRVKEFLNGEKWEPTKRISRAGMERIRFLAKEIPEEWTLPKIATEFKISHEAVRRILKSKFLPTPAIVEHQENKRKEKRLEFLQTVQAETEGPTKPISKQNDNNFNTSKERGIGFKFDNDKFSGKDFKSENFKTRGNDFRSGHSKFKDNDFKQDYYQPKAENFRNQREGDGFNRGYNKDRQGYQNSRQPRNEFNSNYKQSRNDNPFNSYQKDPKFKPNQLKNDSLNERRQSFSPNQNSNDRSYSRKDYRHDDYTQNERD